MKELGSSVITSWHAHGPSLHHVAVCQETGELVAVMQATDRSFPQPSRRPDQCHFNLVVSPDHRRRGIGAALYALVEEFAAKLRSRLIYTAYLEAASRSFLDKRGFDTLEVFQPSFVDLTSFDPDKFESCLRRVEAEGITLTTYSEVEDTEQHRRKLHDLEERARASQPFREVGPYIPEPFETWERSFLARDPKTNFLAIAGDEWVGVVTGLEWYFTGVCPDWQGKGIATALKVRCLTEAKAQGMTVMQTENHEDNHSMLAINRKLGFAFTDVETACVKRL